MPLLLRLRKYRNEELENGERRQKMFSSNHDTVTGNVISQGWTSKDWVGHQPHGRATPEALQLLPELLAADQCWGRDSQQRLRPPSFSWRAPHS